MKVKASMALVGSLFLFGSVVQAAITNPPNGPDWWMNSDAYYWAFAQKGETPVTSGGSNSSFEIVGPEYEDQGDIRKWKISMKNGYREDLYKTFFFCVQGTGPQSSVPSLDSIVGRNDGLADSTVPQDTLSFTTQGDPAIGDWTAWCQGEIIPQSDWVDFVLQLPTINSEVTNWWAGEYCIPLPGAFFLGATGWTLVCALRKNRLFR